MKRNVLFLLLLGLHSSGFSTDEVEVSPVGTSTLESSVEKTEYTFFWDKFYSPFMGANDFLSFQVAILNIEDAVISAVTKEGSNPESWGKRFARAAEIFLFWMPTEEFISVVQHEVFGHGYRIRSFDSSTFSVIGYEFDAPIIYGGSGGGATYFEIQPDATYSQITAINIGGLDAQTIYADVVKMNAITSEVIDGRLAYIYINNRLSGFNYASTLQFAVGEGQELSGHDISDYIFLMNAQFPSEKIKKNQIYEAFALNLVDPMIWYSFWSIIEYIDNGKPLPVPMITLGKWKFLPNIKTTLTPFGMDAALEFFGSYDTKPWMASIHGGAHAQNDWIGICFDAPLALEWDRLLFGIKGHLWSQPTFFDLPILVDEQTGQIVAPPESEVYALEFPNRFGILGSVTARYPIKTNEFYIYNELGGKSLGYVPGYPLSGAFFYRIGCSVSF